MKRLISYDQGPDSRTFASDQPLKDPELDQFQRYPFAKRLAATLAKRSNPTSITVLIHGAWGEGKTTVLEFIRRELEAFSNIASVNFNPWRISDETTLLLSFFSTLSKALKKSSKPTRERIGQALAKYGALVGDLSVDLHGAKLSAGNPIIKIGDALSQVTLEQHRERIEKLISEAGIRIVVFIDDIDRLDREDAQAVFKLLKLTANFSNISYVLAFDRDLVAKAIGEHYGGGAAAGYEYLEKIVQVNINLPVADNDVLTKVCLDAVYAALVDNEIALTPDEEKEFQSTFIQDIAPNLRTPRRAKLYANAAAFTLPLLVGELNSVDLLLLEALRCLYPGVHEHIRSHSSTYTGAYGWDFANSVGNESGNRAKQRLEAVLKPIPPAEAHRVRSILNHLFPQLRKLLASGEYGGFDRKIAAREQRVSLDEYLKRYLTCSVPTGDLSDREIDHYLREVPLVTEDEVDSRYRKLLHSGREDLLLSRFLSRIERLALNSAERVTIAIIRNGDLLPDDPGGRLYNLTSTLVRKCAIASKSAKEYMAIVMAEARPLPLAVDCLKTTLDSRDYNPSGMLTEEDREKLEEILARRIEQYAAKQDLISNRPTNFLPLLDIWQRACGSEPVQTYLGALFSRDPTKASQFLDAFASTALNPTIDDVAYDNLCKLARPANVLLALQKTDLLERTNDSRSALIAQSFNSVHSTQEKTAVP